jgi:hypothetical protein
LFLYSSIVVFIRGREKLPKERETATAEGRWAPRDVSGGGDSVLVW